ncbi:SAV_6107 family HEPN domain-containing protein [Corynebacterium sp. L4756]|uniref:SAV_6107 family HEPN domain-containing protein n=1 Tax=unclassified Corynebacterium TaxID=2624378 RepID=UPI00374CD662
MGQVISATARRAQRAGGSRAKRQRFLTQAALLLADARAQASAGRMDDAMEKAYQAGLRAAGACVAASSVAKRRRLPTSAWDQLALVGEGEKEWAEKFRAYSRTRSRLMTGLDRSVKDSVVFDLMELVARFLESLEIGTYDFDGAGDQAA